ncbi:uncharacterized protein LOC131933138 [Physella acuta]|uniref:uncharacterized protein LOC131933138 n=1 Tax=Physella acuta TaxID=109671 RepID=UPI0027DE22CC|nr:uncharacterized protein LOC131933138 [Physella acuta]
MSLLYALLLVLPALTLAQNDALFNQTATAMFHDVDVNNDHIVDINEVHLSFQKYDTNHDGRITRHEYTTYVASHTPELLDVAHSIYDVYDVDGDHHLDQHDFDNFYGLMDGDGSGTVSEFEFVRYWIILFHDIDQIHG